MVKGLLGSGPRLRVGIGLALPETYSNLQEDADEDLAIIIHVSFRLNS